MIDKVAKLSLFIMVDSGNIYNFINTQVANTLQCNLKSIKALTMKIANGGAIIF